MFSPDMVAPTKEPIDQVDNNSDVLQKEEQSLVNERVENLSPSPGIDHEGKFENLQGLMIRSHMLSLWLMEFPTTTKMLSRAHIDCTGKRL